LKLYDGWYIVGEGRLMPVKDEEAGKIQMVNLLDE